ncbi:MAG: peptidylprolyl isomerase [Acidobacteria bacterium]|nr:peptidylprolyl isomerase [Acidobacteriota bacterium]
MFDLFRSRRKTMRYVLGFLLGLVALSMVITLIPGYGTPRAQSDQILAEVAGDPVTLREVQQLLQAQMRNRNFPPEMVQLYIPQLIDQVITERAVAYQAKRMGFEISDDDVALAIRSMLQRLFPGGQFDRQTYLQFLREQGMSIEEFESNIAKNLLLLRLENIVLEGVIVPESEIRQEFHRGRDKIALDYVAISPAGLRSQVTVTPQELQDHYNKNRAVYKTSEKRSFHVLIADEQKVAATIEMPDSELRRFYEANKERYRTPERVKVRHILVMTQGKPEPEVKKLEAKAGDLLRQLRAGADFADLARKNSEDPGSAAKGGDLDWVVRGQTVKNFEDTAFSLKPGELSNVIKTEYGYHIMQVLDKETARVKPFEKVKGEIASSQKRQMVFDKLQNSIEQARAELVRNSGQAETIAQKYGLIYAKADNVAQGQSVPEVGTNRELESTVLALKPGEVSQVVQLGPSRLGVAALTSVQAPRQAELAEVESGIREQLTSDKVQKLVEQKTQEFQQKLKAAGGDLRAAAKAAGLEVKSSALFNLEGTVEGLGAGTYFQEGFGKPIGSTVGPVRMPESTVFAKVAQKEVADEAAYATERESVLLNLKRKKAQERRELFQDGVVAQLTKDGKIKKYPDAIKRLSSYYRG